MAESQGGCTRPTLTISAVSWVGGRIAAMGQFRTGTGRLF